jgi:hypothetical protein
LVKKGLVDKTPGGADDVLDCALGGSLGFFLRADERFGGTAKTKAAAVRRSMFKSKGALEYNVTDRRRAPTFRRKSTAKPNAVYGLKKDCRA